MRIKLRILLEYIVSLIKNVFKINMEKANLKKVIKFECYKNIDNEDDKMLGKKVYSFLILEEISNK
jgi:hypothetical protein